MKGPKVFVAPRRGGQITFQTKEQQGEQSYLDVLLGEN